MWPLKKHFLRLLLPKDDKSYAILSYNAWSSNHTVTAAALVLYAIFLYMVLEAKLP